MDSASLFDLSVDTPWFVHVAANPLLNLLELHPHLNVSTLSPPTNAVKFGKNQLERRDNCYTFSDNSHNSDNNTSSSPSGALIGGIIGGVVVLILLLVLAWFLWRRRRRQRQQNQNMPNNATLPPGAVPTPYDPGHNAPPMMTQTGPGGYDMNAGTPPGPNYTPAAYPAPPSSAGWSTTNASSTAPLTGNMANDRQGYYNYAPPPAEPVVTYPQQQQQQQQWNPAGAMYSNTPSPPPPSTTPGATSTHSGTTSGYAPWAIPLTSSPGPSVSGGVASGSSSPAPPPPGAGGAMMFPTAAEEKAHYSRNKEDEANKSRLAAPTPAPPAYDGPR